VSPSKPIGSAVRTYTGVLFDFVNPEQSSINLMDISHSLSLLCRFAGHCKRFYSVAEHAVRVSYICPPGQELWGLHHDDSESYCVDVPRPLKHLAGMESYRAHEKRVQLEIVKMLGFDVLEEPAEVKLADMVLLVTEQRDLLHNSIPDFNIIPLRNQIKPWPSWLARRLYQLRHAELMGWKLKWHDKLALWWLQRNLK
jgi:hypothetical protein